MQTSTTDGKVFELRAESEADQLFIEALDMQGTSLRWERMVRERIPYSGAFANVGAVLCIDTMHPASVRAHAGRQALSALGQLISLGLGEAANNRVVLATPTDPQTQEQLTACLVQLQVVTGALLGIIGGKQEFVGKDVVGTHGSAPVVEKTIVDAGGTGAQGGAA